MKKQNLILLSILGIILLVGIIVGIFYATGVFQSALMGGIKVQASNNDDKSWNLGAIGSQSLDCQGEKLSFIITHPSENGIKEKMLCDKINSLTSETCEYQGTTEATSTFNSRVQEQDKRLLGNKFMVFDGYYLDVYCVRHDVKTYGICDGFNCYLIDPAPDVCFSGSFNECGNVGGFIAEDWKLYFKDGGYTEDSGKIEFGFTIIDTDIKIFRLENNICNESIIKESEKLTSDYENLEDCEKNIIKTPTEETQPEVNKIIEEVNNAETTEQKEEIITNSDLSQETKETLINQVKSGQTITYKPNFWNQETLGLKNSSLIISLIGLVIIFIIVFVIVISISRRK